MTTPRADRETTPLVSGRFYLVPTVRAKWRGKLSDWPVIGPEHKDGEFFNFKQEHYHLDARFLRAGHWGINKTLIYPLHGDITAWYAHRENTLPKPVWKRLKCRRATNHFDPYHPAIARMRQHYAGQQCAQGKGGWICPHQKAALGSVVTIAGVIICPLHGLRINAETGVVLPAEFAA